MGDENSRIPEDSASPTGTRQASAAQSPVPPTPQPYVPNPEGEKKGGAGWKIALVVIVAVVVLAVIGVVSCSQAASSLEADAFSMLGGSKTQSATSPNTVAIIYLDGTIQYDGSSCSPEGLEDLLQQAEEDSNISAVVLRVNSGGGTSTAGEEMSRLVRDFSKPIVVSAASIDCSAAYMISSQADYLYTANSSEVGSIGTAMQVTNYEKLLKALAIDVDNIVSAQSKDSSYGTRALTKKERAYYQKMVDEINDQFIETVASGRHMAKSKVEKLATGLPFVGKEAVKLGLFDEVGSLDDACAKASELAGGGDDYTTMTLDNSSTIDDVLSLLSEQNSTDGSSTDDSDSSMSDLEKALKELSNDGIR